MIVCLCLLLGECMTKPWSVGTSRLSVFFVECYILFLDFLLEISDSPYDMAEPLGDYLSPTWPNFEVTICLNDFWILTCCLLRGKLRLPSLFTWGCGVLASNTSSWIDFVCCDESERWGISIFWGLMIFANCLSFFADALFILFLSLDVVILILSLPLFPKFTVNLESLWFGDVWSLLCILFTLSS